jgi:hypothetical protein
MGRDLSRASDAVNVRRAAVYLPLTINISLPLTIKIHGPLTINVPPLFVSGGESAMRAA